MKNSVLFCAKPFVRNLISYARDYLTRSRLSTHSAASSWAQKIWYGMYFRTFSIKRMLRNLIPHENFFLYSTGQSHNGVPRGTTRVLFSIVLSWNGTIENSTCVGGYILQDGWQCFRCDKRATTWRQPSSGTNWTYDMVMSQVVCRPFVMDVVHPSLSSMSSTAPREGWSSAGTTFAMMMQS